MKWNKKLIPTKRENPREAETVSHRLLVRAGFIKQHQSGVYAYLPLGQKVIRKIASIIREEMNAINAQEMLLPSLTSGEIWKESGRWDTFGSDMFRLKDRWGHDLSLAPTHEEIMTQLAREFIKSYRDMPQIWYQIQTKFRDEPRPRGGLLRVREFAMKDSYSFDASWEGLDASYAAHRTAYQNIFRRVGLHVNIVKASSGLMGGGESEEFMVIAPSGEDKIVYCEKCGYSSNMEVASGKPVSINAKSKFQRQEKVHTPGVRTVKEVAEFLGVEPSLIVKSLLYTDGEKIFLVLIRGDYDVNENKLSAHIGRAVRLLSVEQVIEKFSVQAGFVGPIDIDVDEIIADTSIKELKDFVVGGNRNDYHIVGVNIEDINIMRFVDTRQVREGDYCEVCGHPLRVVNGIEVGHIFKLGIGYSKSLGAFFTDKSGGENPIIMGSYGIGLGRVMSTVVEVHHDDRGIVWPMSIAPFEVDLLEVDTKKTGKQAEELYSQLLKKGVDVIWDNREVSCGVKFKDAELVGIPIVVVLSERKLKQGMIEIQLRKEGKKYDISQEGLFTELEKVFDKYKNEQLV